MKLRCPVCHSSYSLEALVADSAAHETIALLAGTGPAFRPLAHYLGLFRSGSRDLSWSRALRLAKEALELEPDHGRLAVALSETVEAMRAKRQAGDVRPLTNHNYLRKVLESVRQNDSMPMMTEDPALLPPAPRGKRAQAAAVLWQWAGEDWLRVEIAKGMIALLADTRQGAPAADTIAATASIWETLLREDAGLNIPEVDTERIYKGFKALLKEVGGWPEGRDLLNRLPRRPDRMKIEQEVSDEERARVAAGLREYLEGRR